MSKELNLTWEQVTDMNRYKFYHRLNFLNYQAKQKEMQLRKHGRRR